MYRYVRGPFAKFVNSPYWSDSELCGGAVTVPFSKYLPWQAMHFLQRSTHFSKTCCRQLITSKFLASEIGAPFSWLEKPRNLMGRDLDCMADVLMGIHQSTFSKPNPEFRSCPMRFLDFPNHEKGAPRQEISKLSTICSMFRKWVGSCKKCIAYQGRYFEKRDRHRTSTKFRLGLTRWVHELRKRPSYRCKLHAKGQIE
jgi:hypothetical protein